MWIIVSVTIRLSSLSLKRQASRARFPLRHSVPRMGPLLLNYTTGSERVVCFVWRQKIAGDIYWLLLKWIACRCVAWSKSGETHPHSLASSSCLMQKYILESFRSTGWQYMYFGVCRTPTRDESCREKGFIVTSMNSGTDTKLPCCNMKQVKISGLIC